MQDSRAMSKGQISGNAGHEDTSWSPAVSARMPPLPALRLSLVERLIAALTAVVGTGVFILAAVLHPYDEAGRPLSHGTHRQLGLPACTLLLATGVPCISCGMTTSVALTVRGDLPAAANANWAGMVLTLLGLPATVWLAALAAAGRQPAFLSVERTIQWLACSGATVAVIRYLGLGLAWLAGE